MKIGDVMTEEQVEDWVNVLPPATHTADLVQLGEPYSHREDAEGRWKATYLTAAKVEGRWLYKGPCFRGSIVSR